jgi:hypothetical protein
MAFDHWRKAKSFHDFYTISTPLSPNTSSS